MDRRECRLAPARGLLHVGFRSIPEEATETSNLDSITGLTRRFGRAPAALCFAVFAACALALLAWPDRVQVRLLWGAPDRLVALWQCKGQAGWPLLLVDVGFSVGLCTFLVFFLARRSDVIGAVRSVWLASFLAGVAGVVVARDLALALAAAGFASLGRVVLPAIARFGWVVPILALAFAVLRPRAGPQPRPPGEAGAGGEAPRGDLLGAARQILGGAPAMLVSALTLVVVVTALWSRSAFLVQRVELAKDAEAEGITNELAGTIFATELRREAEVGFRVHSGSVKIQELSDLADWTIPGSESSLRSVLSYLVRGDRIVLAASRDPDGWKVFVRTSSGIAFAVDEDGRLKSALRRAARQLIREECGADPSEVVRPACALIRLERGDRFLEDRLPEAAAAEYAKALALDGACVASSLVHVSRGRLAATRGPAKQTLSESIGHFQQAERCMDAIPDAEVRSTAQLLLYHHWGWASFLADQWDDARIHFEKAAQADPTSAYGYHDLGRLALRNGDYASAERSFSGAIKMDPKSPYSWCDRAETRNAMGRPQQALGDFAEAAKLGALCGHLGYATILRRLARFDEAVAALRKTAEDPTLRSGDPKWIWAYQDLGDLEIERGGDTAAARAWYARAEEAEGALHWPSEDDRREVLGGLYTRWLRLLAEASPEHRVLTAKLEALSPRVGSVGAPPRNP